MKKQLFLSLFLLIFFSNTSKGVEALKVKKNVMQENPENLESLIESSLNHYSIHQFENTKKRTAKINEKLALFYFRTKIQIEYKRFETKIDRIQLDSCDLIIFNDGEEISAKIIEINEEHIIFKRCDFLDGPDYKKEISKVFMIKYRNGTKEIINSKNDPIRGATDSNDSNPYNEENNSFLLIGGLFSGLLIGVFGFLISLLIEKGPKRKLFNRGVAVGVLVVFLILLLANLGA